MSFTSPRPQRQPMFNIPGIILGLIALMTAIHVWRENLTDAEDFGVLSQMAFVPIRMALQFMPDAVTQALQQLAIQGQAGALEAQQSLMFLGHGDSKPWTTLSYALLHGDYSHLALNCFWLLAFGSAVAKRFGAARFFIFFAITAMAGALAHLLAHPLGTAPVIGASASVSGAMAAAARFMFQPDGPIGKRGSQTTFHRPALPLVRIFRDVRVLQFLGVWFVINLATGIAAVPLGISQSGIAWEAHIGGFLAGLLLFDLFDPPAEPAVSGLA